MMTFNHGLSGYVCAQVAMPLLRRRSPLPERALSWAFLLGAMLPDTDIVVRVLFGRAAYFSGAWYGHRGFSHSLLGTLALALLAAALLWRPLAGAASEHPRRAFAWLVGCCWAGGILHIFGDLFTPGWQMPVLWPFAWRFGAWRHIGWFSPYLLWLFLGAILLALLGTRLLRLAPRLRPWAPALGWAVYTVAAARWVSFLLQSRYTNWDDWVAGQQALLPDALVGPVAYGVGVLWRWFTG